MSRTHLPLAKFTRPASFEAAQRPRLFGLMDRCLRSPVIWVAAPPGAGKTTLVASYMQDRGLGGIWYQVDSGDADPAAFFLHLGLAQQSNAPRRRRPLPLLTPAYLPDIASFARRWFREFFLRLAPASVLVLDNYQDGGRTAEFHAIVEVGCSEVPAGCHVVLISRDAPSAVYSRLQASERLALVQADELRLTLEEAREIISGKDAPGDEVVRALHQGSNGWAAGFTMMRDIASRTGQVGAALREQDLDTVFNYFATQLFELTQAESRDCLIRTAFLPRITAALARRVCGSAAAVRLLEDLHRRRLFTERTFVGEEAIYQYHALFRAFLQAHAKTLYSEPELLEIKRAAARALEAADHAEEALLLHLEAEDWPAASQVLLTLSPRLNAQGRDLSLASWIGRLPVSELDAHPALKFYLGVGQAYIQPELGRSTLEQAVEAFSTWPSMDMEIMATVAIITVYVHAYSRWERMDPWADRLVALLADSSRTASAPVRERGLTVLLFARAYCSADRQVLVGLAAQGRKILEQGSDINSRLDAASQLINAYGWIGDLAQEEAIVALAQPLLNDAQAQPWLRIGWYTHAARYWWVGRADHARAAQTLRRGLEVAEETGLTALNGYLHALLFNVHIDEGDLAAAAALGASIEDRQAAGQRYAPAMVLPGKALLALLQGDGVSARIHALAGVAAADDWGSTTQRAMACFLLVIVLVATGDREEARARLDAYQAAQRRIPGLMDDYLQLLLRAYLAIERQETQHGDELLGCALAMARKQGYINHLYWYPPMMSALYARALRCGIETDFVIQVIRKRSLRPVSNGIENWPWPLKIHTLGRFEILKDDKALVFGRKTPTRLIELLRAILAFGGREVATARLIDVVWPDQDGDSAAEALQVSLHRLRKLIGNHTIAVRDGRIFLDPNQVWVDAWAFEQWVEDFAEDRARGRERLLELSERALALYRGAFLGAEVDAPWALGTRERLRIKFIALVCGLGKGLVDAGAVEEALHHHLRALDADDQAEEIYQGALRCYRQLNRRAEAQALYRRLRATLAINFGVEPAPATEALLQEPFRP